MTYPQVDVQTGTGWSTCDILGYGANLDPVEALMPPPLAEPTSIAANVIDFEDQGYKIFNSVQGAVLSSAYAHSGAYGCRLTPDPSTGVASLTSSASFPGGHPWASISLWFRLATLPAYSDTYMNLFEIGNAVPTAPKSQFTVFFKNNVLTCDFNNTETQAIATVTDTGWHRFEARITFGATTYSGQMRLDGGITQTLTSQNNKTVSTAEALWVHYPTVAVDYTLDVDDILLTTADADPGWLRAT